MEKNNEENFMEIIAKISGEKAFLEHILARNSSLESFRNTKMISDQMSLAIFQLVFLASHHQKEEYMRALSSFQINVKNIIEETNRILNQESDSKAH